MNNADKIIKRCRALALAGMIGITSLGSSLPAFAAGPGDDSSRVSEISTGGPGDPGNTNSSNSTTNTGNSNNSNSNNNTNNSNNTNNTNNSNTSSNNTTTNTNAWKKVNGTYQMSDGSAIQNVLHRGIDVSRWQGEINWSQVAKDDISFVMLGTRSKGAVDPYFHKNIQNATANGVKVGVYIYSLATTTDMAVQEADFVLNLITDYPISYPVAFDMEDSTQGNLSKSELAAIANAFCKRISAAGYYPIIYANENWLNNKLDMSQMNYPVWVARYSARYTWQNPVMWQATSSGSVKGINGNVDIDFQFKDFTSVIPANTWRTINGKRYYYANYEKQKNAWAQDVNDWYYMDKDGLASTGWITVADARYYLDTTTGKMQTGWYKLPVTTENTAASDNTQAEDSAETATASQATAADQEDNSVSLPAISGYKYYDEDGKRASGWRTIEGVENISEDGEYFRFYFKNGAPYYGKEDLEIFTIDSKKYAFNTAGEMQTGKQSIRLSDGTAANYYFDEEGIMKTGKQTIYDEDLGETQNWLFHAEGSKKGQGYHGIKDNTLYVNGLRQEADKDLRFAPVSLDDTRYLVNVNGAVQKAGSTSKSASRPELGSGYKDFKDENDMIWTVNTEGIIQ